MVKVLPKTLNKDRKISIPFSLYKRSTLTTYRKLPEQLLKLSVLKLDGSSFGFYVARNATVARLKLAIEEEFSLCSKDEGKNLWSLVWSHFCLSYEGQKLIKEKDCIQNYGIKDGDQLHFIQHLRIDLPPSQERPKNQSLESRSCSVSHARDAIGKHHVSSEDQYGNLKLSGCGEETDFTEPRLRLSHSLKELVSCSKFRGLKRKVWEEKNCT
ncbi:hypothetical protein BUALT_Bualt07G0128800 [Buddleja alternifolia]|uniref:SNRNP25 ubiquitin-like domain-containing protein n=1 Tax=Buddleja alternifolia TaxID=168488 RepID=A0AAV6XH10_9LAMI|nr:hypothetical protein BUALT_Bualt07G0128800 [Buddleja alternifolia]